MKTLPKVRGSLEQNGSLKEHTWFKVGGPAEILFKPADKEDLQEFLKKKPKEMPVTILGLGSNIIIRDGGIKGVVILLGETFQQVEIEGEGIKAGARASDLKIAQEAQKASLTGIEFLSGIPGTIGGAVHTNAGAYGGELKNILTHIEALNSQGEEIILLNEDCHFSYRHSEIPEGIIFVNIHLRGQRGDAEKIKESMKEIQIKRKTSQPIREKTGGSTFKNPEGFKAWELIDKAGCRGLTRGGAMMSEKHCNFMINTGTATAKDLETLGEEVRQRVQKTSGIVLEWEIKRIGESL